MDAGVADAALEVINGSRADEARDAIAERIATGRWRAGQRLPSERRLSAALGVSRVTVRKALATLVEDGVVEVAHGRGWFVAAEAASDEPNVLLSFTAMAHARGLTPTATVRAHVVREATIDEAEQLRIAPGAHVLELERVRLLNGIPVALDRNVVPIAHCPDLADADFTIASLYAILRDEAGLIPSSADTTVEAAEAGDAIAELLDVSPTSPVLITTQTTYDQHGRALDASRITYRGDRHRFHARLTVART
ncbi:MAG TPA: GntR family transcriptional regulator [Actinomycetota bacterium]|nr:GntR family transcriptional regulator [Actinomycetota bacterium]